MDVKTINGQVYAPLKDIGALIERTDCKFIRIAFVGDIGVESHFDFIELEEKKLNNTKTPTFNYDKIEIEI